MKSGDTVRGGSITSLTPMRQLQHALSFPIVIFATIFFSTVFRFVNFLSLVSAASSSARNSCKGPDTAQNAAGDADGGEVRT